MCRPAFSWFSRQCGGGVQPRRFVPTILDLENRLVPAFTAQYNAVLQELTIIGKNGNDAISVTVNAGSFQVNGSAVAGDPTLANTVKVNLLGGAGNDILSADLPGFTGELILNGGTGKDNLSGGNGPDTLLGGEGDDTLYANDGDDMLNGGGGADSLNGGNGDDTLTGGNGNDFIDGGINDDVLTQAGNFNYKLTPYKLSTSSRTGGNKDTLANLEAARLTGGAGNNILNAAMFSGLTTLDGGAGNDTLTAGAGRNVLSGRAGNDVLIGRLGNDELREIGNVNFVLTNNKLIGLGTDRVVGIEKAELTGGNKNNNLNASTFGGSVTLNGGFGSDTLGGGTGDDELNGGFDGDADVLRGGIGADTFHTEFFMYWYYDDTGSLLQAWVNRDAPADYSSDEGDSVL